MPVVKTTTPTALAGTLVVSRTLSSTPNENVTGNSSGSIYQIRIDNSANRNASAYVKIADSATASAATTTPNWVFPVRGGQVVTYIMDTGVAYTAGVSIWCTTTPGTGSQGTPGNLLSFSILAT